MHNASCTSFAVVALLVAACNAKVATVLESSDGGGPPSSSSGGTGSACVAAQDCNANPAQSSLSGDCVGGRCVCHAGAASTSSGKCMPAACTPGQDQTCNDRPEMSALAGTCNADGSCTCSAPSAKLRSGRCGTASTVFPEYLSGTWLIGWSGGLEHFSWLRLWDAPGPHGGIAEFLPMPRGKGGVAPYWECEGSIAKDTQGSWVTTAKMNTIVLQFPTGCPTTGIEASYTFMSIMTATSGTPKGAIMSATFEIGPTGQRLVGFKFPDSQCATDMSSCIDPFR